MMMRLRTYLGVLMAFAVLCSGAFAEDVDFSVFLEQYLIPVALQSTDENFSADELHEVSKIIEKYGIELPEESREILERKLFFDIGYSKKGMLWMIFAAEYGETNIQWPVNVQKWYNDLIAGLGLGEYTNLAIPEGDEISQETAIAIAEEHIYNEYREAYRLDDLNFYQRGQTYLIDQTEASGNGRYWTIYYFPLVLEAGKYEILLDSKGNIIRSQSRNGFGEGSSFKDMYDMIMEIYGISVERWPQKAYQELKKAAVFAEEAEHSKLADILNETTYPDIDDEAIAKEEAYRIAANQLGFSSYSPMGAVYIQAIPNPIWKVNIDDYFYFEIDSVTGEIKECYERSGSYQDWESRITLKRIKDKIDKKWKNSEKAFG